MTKSVKRRNGKKGYCIMRKFISIALCLSLMLSALCALSSCSDKKEENNSKTGTNTAYVLCEKENAYSLSLATAFKTAFEKSGGKVTVESFPKGTTGFSEYFEKAIDVGAKVIFLPNSASVANDMLKNAKDLGIDVPILAGDTWESSIVLEAVKETGMEVYCTTFFDEVNYTSDKGGEFVSGFKKFLSENSEYYEMNGDSDMVSAVSALGFDAYNVTISAIRAAAEEKGSSLTSLDVAKALWNTEHHGVTGKMTFDSTGDAIKTDMYIKKAADDGSAFEFVKLQTVENDGKKGSAPEYSGEGVSIDTDNKRITVGVYEPTTGNDSAGGKQELLGIIYANRLDDKITVDGEEYTVELFVSDNASLAENALAAATKIIDANAVAVIGSYGSGVSIAAAETFSEANIPAVGASCTNPEVTSKSNLYFRTTLIDPYQGSVMSEFAFSLIEK